MGKITDVFLAAAMIVSCFAVPPAAFAADTGLASIDPNKPVAIIKLDDLRNGNMDKFKRVADIGKQRGIPLSIGIIGNSLEDDGNKQKYYDFIKETISAGDEIWHHGWNHTRPEYSTNTYEQQKESFGKTVRLLQEKCGYTVQTFGSPFNNSSATTIDMINKEFPQIKVIMLAKDPNNAATQLMLPALADLELTYGVVDYDNFLINYNNRISEKSPCIVMQGHPQDWDDTDIAEFNKIIDFLQAEGVQMMTPLGYYEKVWNGSNPHPMPTVVQTVPTVTPVPTPIEKPTVPVPAPDPNAINVIFNGANLEFDVAPKVVDGRTMVPFRAIFDKLQATVSFDEATGTATALKGEKEVKITNGSGTAYVGGKAVVLDTAATIIDGRFLVPLRFVSESMDCLVYWDEARKKVFIRSTKPEKLALANPEGSIPIKGCAFSAFFDGDNGAGEFGQLTYDGDINTCWSANGDGQWVVYDLGESTEVSRVSVIWNKGDKRRAVFEILLSDDGEQFASVLEGKGAGNILDKFEDYALPPESKGRYVKVLCKGNNENKWNAMKEIIFY